MKKLLLHVCCGPCAVYVAKKLRGDYQIESNLKFDCTLLKFDCTLLKFDCTLFFYNPNIWPREEYDKRLGEVKTWASSEKFELIEGEFNQDSWFEKVVGLEAEPEGGARCPVCYQMRLEESARFAQENGFEALASTLTIGRNKKAAVINPIGSLVAKKYGLEFLEADWKKQGGQEEACRLSKESNMYRQDYCGCKFSINN
jgi:hypothetical protein